MAINNELKCHDHDRSINNLFYDTENYKRYGKLCVLDVDQGNNIFPQT